MSYNFTNYDNQNQNFNNIPRQEMGMGTGMDAHTSAQSWQGGQTQHQSMGSAPMVQSFPQIQVLRSATHFELMLSGNEVYSKLYNESVMLKCQLEVQKERVLELRADLKESQQAKPRANDSVALDPRDTSSLARANDSQPLGLIIPPAPPSLVKEEYPQLVQKFWTKSAWKNYEEAEQNANRNPSKHRYLCDEDGFALSESRIEEMGDAAKLGFNELFFWRLDPKSWGKRVDRANQYFSNTMRIKFPELGLCDGDWKLTEFATDRFPAWNRYHREGKTVSLSRARPSKRKAAEVDDEKKVRKEKKRKHTKIPVPASDVITLTDTENADDIYDDPPQRPHLKTTQSAEQTTQSTTQSAERRSQPPAPGTKSPTNVPAVASKPVTPISQETDVPNATAPRSPSDAASASKSHPPSPRQEPTPARPLTTAASASESCPPSPHQESTSARPSTTNVEAPMAATPHVRDAGDVPQAATPKDASDNPFAGLFIPKPPAEVTQSTTSNTENTSTPGSTSTATNGAQGKGKKGKPMVPSPSLLTPRNLYAIDCVKANPCLTAAEFKEMFRLLDPTSLKKYEEISKERKAAAKLD